MRRPRSTRSREGRRRGRLLTSGLGPTTKSHPKFGEPPPIHLRRQDAQCVVKLLQAANDSVWSAARGKRCDIVGDERSRHPGARSECRVEQTLLHLPAEPAAIAVRGLLAVRRATSRHRRRSPRRDRRGTFRPPTRGDHAQATPAIGKQRLSTDMGLVPCVRASIGVDETVVTSYGIRPLQPAIGSHRNSVPIVWPRSRRTVSYSPGWALRYR